MDIDVRRLTCLCAYTLSCAVLHGLLQQHYIATCRSSWLSLFALDPGPYCAVVRKGLSVLQWSPLVVSGAWLPQLAHAHQAPLGAAA
jgi:hypothetical protein